MASSIEYVQYVCEQIRGTGDIRFRKMFGDYMVYVNDKPIFLVCEDTVYVKILPELAPLLEKAERGMPYTGAKEHSILDIDDAALSCAVARILEQITPLPRPRKKRTK